MKFSTLIVALILLLSVLPCWAEPPGPWKSGTWTKIASLENTEGYAGAFSGDVEGSLLLAGGANFPNAKPWEGGKKEWYSGVYQLDKHQLRWELIGHLPRSLGYGVSASYQGRLICVGGSDADKHYADVFSLEVKQSILTCKELPALPTTLANASGALIGERLFVVGGQETPSATTALKEVWSLDLSQADSEWKMEIPIPGPGRILSTCGSNGDQLFVFGGVELFETNGVVKRKYLQDAYAYRPGEGWRQIADVPHPLAACASPAPTWKNKLFLVSGDDGTQVGKFSPEHRGFPNSVWAYDVRKNDWTQIDSTPAPRVTLPSIQIGADVYFLSGEKTPGIRSPENWRWNLETDRNP